MRRVINTLAAVLALACPLYARAVPVYVDYEGTIGDVTRFGCRCDPMFSAPANDPGFAGYATGDPIKGRLVMDTDRDGGDAFYFDTALSAYGNARVVGALDFISGNGPEASHPTETDYLWVEDRKYNGSQRYELNDGFSLPRGDASLYLNAVAERADMLVGDGIVQSFDVVPDHKTHLTGRIQKFVEDARGVLTGVDANFLLSRLTVSSPGSCHR